MVKKEDINFHLEFCGLIPSLGGMQTSQCVEANEPDSKWLKPSSERVLKYIQSRTKFLSGSRVSPVLASNTQSESLLLWGFDFVFMCSLSPKGQKQEFPSLRCELDWGGGRGGIQPAGHIWSTVYFCLDLRLRRVLHL